MRRLKEVLTDCLLIVPYTVIWLIALLAAAVVVAWRWIAGKIGGKAFWQSLK